MAVSAQRITVSSTAVALNTDVGPVGGTKLVVTNTGTGVVDLGPGDQLFAISGTTATLHVLRIG